MAKIPNNAALNPSGAMTISGRVRTNTLGMSRYVNGVPVGSPLSASVSMSDNGLNARIGSSDNNGLPFNGVIDNVRVYNRALSQSEIQTDMNTA